MIEKKDQDDAKKLILNGKWNDNLVEYPSGPKLIHIVLSWHLGGASAYRFTTQTSDARERDKIEKK